MKAKIFTAVVIACIVAFYSISAAIGPESGIASSDPVTETTEISMVCVGDIMAHKSQYEGAYNSDTGEYNFEFNYKYVKSYIESADVAFCNVETVFGGGEPCGYPTFNGPDELADNLKTVGFDVAFTSNNHMIDQGTKGVLRNLETLQDAGLSTVGSKLEESYPDYIVIDVKGVKIGVVSYTYETTKGDGAKAINGIDVPSDIESRICSFNPEKWERDMTKITDNIQAARDEGADMIVCYFHWGEEYSSNPMKYQEEMANKLAAEQGVDVIYASHPHVVEKADAIWSEAYNKYVPVYYSMGNFISNQRSESLGANRRNTEDGIIAMTTFEVTMKDGAVDSVTLKEASALPTWVIRYKSGSKWKHEIIPLDSSYEENQALVDNSCVSKAETSLEATSKTLGSGYVRSADGRIIIWDGSAPATEETDAQNSDAQESEEAGSGDA